ncbi:NAD(P)-binding protein [Decorospora gaudefroyi]|uniref:NAD(P)-binding protein n=1 Tax=Decorospora gaudefroyi TaxID=184978 RepID=A0A6A5JY70_9PLEO|nr:NAD(P)-binding protein [Decorospora gaudefroyi]
MSSEPKYIRKVALIGGTGHVGSHILKHLLGTSQHTITALTRQPSSKFPTSPNLNVLSITYDDQTALINALRGHDFLIITLSARAPPTLHRRLVSAAATAGIPYVLPNYYGYGLGAHAIRDPIADFSHYITDVAQTPDVSYVALVCGSWYEFSLAMGEPWFGFRIRDRSVTLYGDGRKKVSVSTWERCGEGVASLLCLPVGEGVARWKDKEVYVSSFLVSQRDMLESLHRVLGTTDAEWTISYEEPAERLRAGKEQFAKGEFLGFAKALYAAVFVDENADFETRRGVDNGALGLGSEDLDAATRRAVAMAEGEIGDLGY